MGLHRDTYLASEQTRPGPDLHVWICRLGAQTADKHRHGRINTESKEECGPDPTMTLCVCVWGGVLCRVCWQGVFANISEFFANISILHVKSLKKHSEL